MSPINGARRISLEWGRRLDSKYIGLRLLRYLVLEKMVVMWCTPIKERERKSVLEHISYVISFIALHFLPN